MASNKGPGIKLRRVGSPPWNLETLSLQQLKKKKYPQNPAREGAEEGFNWMDLDGTMTWTGIRTMIQWNNVLYARSSTKKAEG